MNFISEGYLPNSEERVRRLRKIVNGRPVAIIAAGPSIYELENRIGDLRHNDICYVGMNNFFIQEKYILQKIDKHFSICYNVFFITEYINDKVTVTLEFINDFLDRNEENMFISMLYGSCPEPHRKFISKYDKKLLFTVMVNDPSVPSNDRPLHFYCCNTLLVLIQLMIIGGAQKIVLFGADGGYPDGAECYYRSYEYGYRADKYGTNPRPGLTLGAEQFNSVMDITIKNTYDTYNILPIEIFNCSVNSLYTPFPKISYDIAFDILNDRKK